MKSGWARRPSTKRPTSRKKREKRETLRVGDRETWPRANCPTQSKNGLEWATHRFSVSRPDRDFHMQVPVPQVNALDHGPGSLSAHCKGRTRWIPRRLSGAVGNPNHQAHSQQNQHHGSDDSNASHWWAICSYWAFLRNGHTSLSPMLISASSWRLRVRPNPRSRRRPYQGRNLWRGH